MMHHVQHVLGIRFCGGKYGNVASWAAFGFLTLFAALIPVSCSHAQDAGAYTLSVPESTTLGESITIRWTTPSPRPTNTSRSWIGYYTPGKAGSQPVAWERIPDTATSGSYTVTPSKAGTYEARLYRGATYTEVASATFSVTGSTGDDDDDDQTGSYTLSAPTNATTGDSVTATWTTPSPRTAATNRSWIGYYAPGAADSRPLKWERIPDTQTIGTYTVTATTQGATEFRLFEGATYKKVATASVIVEGGDTETGDYTLSTPSSVQAGTSVTATWTTPSPRTTATNRSWVGVYNQGAADARPVFWSRISDTQTTGTYAVTLTDAGQYEFRLFEGATYKKVATTVLQVTGDDDDDNTTDYVVRVFPTSLARGGTIFVEWSGPASDTNNGGLFSLYNNDWVGVYTEGARDQQPYAWRRVSEAKGVMSFDLLAVGTYEVRYFKGATYNKIYTSEKITVTDSGTANMCNGTNLDTITNYPNNTGPVIAVGNSLTAGVGATTGQDYVSELERRLNITIDNQGVSGDTTADVLARLDTDVLSKNPSTVIVFIGGNDELRRLVESLRNAALPLGLLDELETIAAREGYNYDQVELLTRDQSFENLKTIVERIQATGAETIVVGIDMGIFSSSLDERYAAVATQTGSAYVPDIFEGVFGRADRMSDRVHPNDAGYDLFATRIGNVLQCLLP